MPFLKDKQKVKLPNTVRLDNLTKKNGLRHAIFTPTISKDRYKGEWMNNLKDGKGSMLTRTKRLYGGEWEKNFRHGFGVFALGNDDNIFILQYRGEWKWGYQSGFGARHYPDGSYYTGYWKNGKRHGYGQMWYANGAFYDGDWYRDMRNGFGMWIRSDGNRYEGAWVMDMRQGKGRFYHLDSGQLQEGIWYQDYCIYSSMIDIPFRQSAKEPTPYPVVENELAEPEDVCTVRETQALAGQLNSCHTLSEISTSSDES